MLNFIEPETGLTPMTTHGVERHANGAILYYNQLDIGAPCKLFRPKHGGGDDVSPRTDKDSNAHRQASGNETILVVEDEEIVAGHISRLLRRRGYQVLVSHSAREALAVYDNHPEIDLVVTDVVMPGMNGRELAARLMEKRPALKVLFISAYPRELIDENGILEEGISLIEKPFRSDAFCWRIREMLSDQGTR